MAKKKHAAALKAVEAIEHGNDKRRNNLTAKMQSAATDPDIMSG